VIVEPAEEVSSLKVPMDHNSLEVNEQLKELFEKQEPPAVTAPSGSLPGISNEHLAMAIDRMGQLVLGIKYLFDSLCEASGGELSADLAAGMFLDLRLPAEVYSIVRSRLAGSRVTFPGFLEVYVCHCGLLDKPSLMTPQALWVPTYTGRWIPASDSLKVAVMRAAQPFSSEEYSNNRSHASDELVKSVFLLPLPQQGHLQLGREDPGSVWVRSDEVLEVLLLAGLRAATRSDAEDKLLDGFSTMKHFLPGLQQSGSTPRLCLQELLLLALYLDSPASTDTGGASIATSRDGLSFSKAPYSTLSASATANIFLPFKGLIRTNTMEESKIRDLFKRLDSAGDGRLTFAGLKKAFRSQSVPVEDGLVKKWLREADRAGQGCVDWADFKYIFNVSSGSRASSAAKSRVVEKSSATAGEGSAQVPVGRLTSSSLTAATSRGISQEQLCLPRPRGQETAIAA